VLCDPGRKKEWAGPGKPEGSVHGDSPGVHASDAAHAWQSIALASNTKQRNAAVVLAAWHCAQDNGPTKYPSMWMQRPLATQVERVRGTTQADLLKSLDEAIRGNDQELACAITARYGEAGHAAKPVMELLRDYAISQDGALHAEKYYYTVTSNFAVTSPAMRWRHIIALSRVTASEFGHPAAGFEDAKGLMGVT